MYWAHFLLVCFVVSTRKQTCAFRNLKNRKVGSLVIHHSKTILFDRDLRSEIQSGDDDVDLPKIVQNLNKFTVESVKSILFGVYGDRHYARFAALETIARVPYFSCKIR